MTSINHNMVKNVCWVIIIIVKEYTTCLSFKKMSSRFNEINLVCEEFRQMFLSYVNKDEISKYTLNRFGEVAIRVRPEGYPIERYCIRELVEHFSTLFARILLEIFSGEMESDLYKYLNDIHEETGIDVLFYKIISGCLSTFKIDAFLLLHTPVHCEHREQVDLRKYIGKFRAMNLSAGAIRASVPSAITNVDGESECLCHVGSYSDFCDLRYIIFELHELQSEAVKCIKTYEEIKTEYGTPEEIGLGYGLRNAIDKLIFYLKCTPYKLSRVLPEYAYLFVEELLGDDHAPMERNEIRNNASPELLKLCQTVNELCLKSSVPLVRNSMKFKKIKSGYK